MITISFSFISGRYHATPWGHHVNEGMVEWPPSPWRILRALVASFMKKYGPEDRDREALLRGLLEKMSKPPLFHLPPATQSHTRHYMPWFKKGPGDRTMVLDAFVRVSPQVPVIAVWPEMSVDGAQKRLLEELLAGMTYLGRSESWCRATLQDNYYMHLNDHQFVDSRTGYVLGNCWPVENEGLSELSDTEELVRVLVWNGRGNELEMKLDSSPSKGRFEYHPLCCETSVLRARRLDPTKPSAGEWINYIRPRLSLQCPPREKSFVEGGEYANVVRYALDATVLPLVTDTISIGEMVRRASMSMYGLLTNGDTSPTLSGKDGNGVSLKGHKHAHYIPTDEDGDGRLDHLTVITTSGFSQMDLCALGRLNVLKRGERSEPLRLLFLGSMRWPIRRKASGWGVGTSVPILSQSRVWRSVTPFVLVRHPKFYKNGRPKIGPDGYQVDGPEDQVRLELQRRGFLAPVSIQRLVVNRSSGVGKYWLEYRRWRERGKSPALGSGFGFRIVFEEPVFGPIALGYGSHFGLGLFIPDRLKGE